MPTGATVAVEQLTGAAPPVRRPRTSEPVPRPHAVSGVRDVETPARVVRAAANTPGESAGAPATAPLGGDGGPGTSPGQRRLGVGAPLQRAWRAVPGVEVPDVADEDLSVPGALLRLLALLAGESAGRGRGAFGLPASAADGLHRARGLLDAGRNACGDSDSAPRLVTSAVDVLIADAMGPVKRRPCRGDERPGVSCCLWHGTDASDASASCVLAVGFAGY